MNEQITISETSFVGVFDSGLGGISVLSELVKTMPYMDFEYFGDSANAPYGVKDVEFVMSRAEEICSDFIYRGAAAIVIACNTATSAAAARLREKYSIPIIGMEPAVKPAISYMEEQSINKKIAVLATPMTLKEKKYKHLIRTLEAESRVIEIPSPELVELVEYHFFDEAKVRKIISTYVRTRIDSRDDIGAIVLGCTHFVFLKKYFEEYCEGIRIFDGNAGTARRLSGFFPSASPEKHLFFERELSSELEDLRERRPPSEKVFSREIRRGKIRIKNSAGEEKVELSKKLLRYELDKEDYLFVREQIQDYIEQVLTEETASIAKKYFLERMSVPEIAKQTQKKEKSLYEMIDSIQSGLFKFMKKHVRVESHKQDFES